MGLRQATWTLEAEVVSELLETSAVSLHNGREQRLRYQGSEGRRGASSDDEPSCGRGAPLDNQSATGGQLPNPFGKVG
jgi:hypothetical protein